MCLRNKVFEANGKKNCTTHFVFLYIACVGDKLQLLKKFGESVASFKSRIARRKNIHLSSFLAPEENIFATKNSPLIPTI